MAKLRKSSALLAASTLLGLFFVSGTVVGASAASASIAIKATDPIGTIGSGDNESVDDSDESLQKKTNRELKQEQKKLEKEAAESQLGIKKRKELREKFGSKDALGLPPVVIHPEDDSESEDGSESEGGSANQTSVPKKKTVATPKATPTATATSAVTTAPSIITNTQSIKGGELASESAPAAGTLKKLVETNANRTESVANTIENQTSQQLGSTSSLPGQVAPIDIKTIDFTGKTPTDKFVEAASASIAAMAVGAVALGAMTLVRGKRQQKTVKAEYQYTSAE